MAWAVYITDAQSGLLRQQIDIPSVSWSVDVNDSGLSTTVSRKVGQDQVNNVTVPWSTVPGNTAEQRYESIMPGARGLALFWQSDKDIATGRIGVPIVWGVITNRTDAWDSTSVSVSSVYSLLANRFAIRDGMFKDGTSQDSLTFSGESVRGLASDVGWLCTAAKRGGELPVDWTYRHEKHVHRPGDAPNLHSLTVSAWDVANVSGQTLLNRLETQVDGVDMQFRPYLTSDGYYVREKFVAGNDTDRYLGQKTVKALSVFPGGGTMENVTASYAQPVMRVFGTGSGSDKTTMTASAGNLTYTSGVNPMVLMESAYSNSDVKNLVQLQGEVKADYNANSVPLMQLKGVIDFDDPHTPQPGDIWPGEIVDVDMQGYPSLPDGLYRMRLMQMQGDSTSRATLTFDTMAVPSFKSGGEPSRTVAFPPSLEPVTPPTPTTVLPTSVKIGNMPSSLVLPEGGGVKPSSVTIDNIPNVLTVEGKE